MKLTLVRHTSVDVPKGICYGKTDVPLAKTFRSEMEQVHENLIDEKFDACFSSPLSRCTKLASTIFSESEIITDHRLIELDFGAWEMMSWDTIFGTKKGKEWFADYANTPCLNGESFAELIKRCDSFLAFLRQSSFLKVAIFTHAGVIRAMLSLIQDISPEETFYVPIAYGQIIRLNLSNHE